MRKLFLIAILLVAGLAIFNPTRAEKNPHKPAKPFINSGFIRINNLLLHYRTWPSNLPTDTLPWILMVHGMAGSTYSWERNAPVLAAEGYNVVAIDVPPFGYSEKDPDYNQSNDSRAALLWAFLNQINPNAQWNLIGHSMGGGIVQAMAIIHPERVNKVIFVDPALFGSPGGKTSSGPAVLKFRPFEWIATGIGKLFLVRPKQIRKLLRSAYATEPDAADVAEYYKALHQRGFARAFLRSSVKSKPLIPIDGLKFNKPALAIWGDKDTWVPLGPNQTLLDQLPTVKLQIIEGAGHCPMATHSNIFNDHVLQFFKAG